MNDRMQLEQTRIGDKLVTTIRRIEPDGSESIEVTGEHEILELGLAPEPGAETILTERAR